MSQTARFAVVPSASIFGRMMAHLDRLLMASAVLAVRNGDLPHIGL